MIMAKACVETTQTNRQAAKLARLSESRIKQANVVLEFAAELADSVVAGVGGHYRVRFDLWAARGRQSDDRL
jgi:hypothetical protein